MAPPDCFPFLRDGAVPRLLDALGGRGEEIRLVGGVVRNALLGLPVSDYDCATTALPDEVMRRARRAGLRAVPTGIDHGTVTVLMDHVPFEVTTLREDVTTDGRRATVKFGRSFAHDAARRDFSINALYLDASGKVHDHVGGLDDIRERRVRFIGDPATRIREDYLRILRFFRFHAGYAIGDPDAAGLHACIVLRDGLDILSRERVRVEILKTLAARGAAAVVPVMAATGILGAVLAGTVSLARFARTIAGSVRDPVARLAALAVEVAEDAGRLRDRLRLSNEETAFLEKTAALATDLRGRDYRISSGGARAFLYRHGEAMRPLAMAMLDAAGAREAFAALAAESNWAIPRAPFSGRLLVDAGLTAGPAMGEALAELERQWIAAGFSDDPAVIAKLVAAVVRPA